MTGSDIKQSVGMVNLIYYQFEPITKVDIKNRVCISTQDILILQEVLKNAFSLIVHCFLGYYVRKVKAGTCKLRNGKKRKETKRNGKKRNEKKTRRKATKRNEKKRNAKKRKQNSEKRNETKKKEKKRKKRKETKRNEKYGSP